MLTNLQNSGVFSVILNEDKQIVTHCFLIHDNYDTFMIINYHYDKGRSLDFIGSLS